MVQNTKLLSSLLILLLTSLVTGCGEDPEKEVPPGPDPMSPVLTVKSELPPFSPRGGSAELLFESNEMWNISVETEEGVANDWISITPASGDGVEAGGEIAVAVNVEPNEEYVGRGFTIVLISKSLERRIDVTQLKRNVILLGDNRYEVTYEPQSIMVGVRSNVDYTVSIKSGGDWISEVPVTRSLKEKIHSFSISANPEDKVRTGTIVFKDSNSDLSDEITVVQSAFDRGPEPPDPDPERTGLKSIYESAGGGSWTRSDNWNSDKPLDEWYGVETDSEGHVIALRLPGNNLVGELSPKISNLTHLRHLDLSWNGIADEFGYYDERITGLTELESINLSHNSISGSLPISWYKLTNLQLLDVSCNQLENSIPIQWEPLFARVPILELRVYNNMMSGSVPQAIQNHGEWNRFALQIVRQRAKVGVGGSDLEHDKDYFIPEVAFTSLSDGTRHNSRDIFSGNKLTMLVHWDPLDASSNEFISKTVRRYHRLFNGQRFGVVAITPSGDQYREAARNYIQQHNIPWLTSTDYEDSQGRRIILADYPYTSYLLVDEYGKVEEDVCPGKYFYTMSGIIDDFNTFAYADYLNSIFAERFGNSEYESTDFSRDKTYEILQTATKGSGIDIVLMGEAFTDIDIETGFYRQLMEYSMEAFFSIEPVRSHREYFNVYMVNAVSRKCYIGSFSSQVALGTTSFQGKIESSHGKLESYVTSCPVKSYSNSSPAVIVNNSNAAVTHMYKAVYSLRPNFPFTGAPNGKNLTTFVRNFIHESVGHGFGQLADEYTHMANHGEDIPDNIKTQLQQYQSKGIFQNVSLTNDPRLVYWSHLIGHPKYPYVSVFDGGYAYPLGVWKSEEQSIMNTSFNMYFSAISRQLIYKRIMELSGGSYSFDNFVAQDSDEGRPGTSYSISSSGAGEKSPYIHYPPVFVE